MEKLSDASSEVRRGSSLGSSVLARLISISSEVLVFPQDCALKLSDTVAEAGVRLGYCSVFGGVLSQRQTGADVA